MYKRTILAGFLALAAVGTLLLLQTGSASSRPSPEQQANAELSILEISSDAVSMEFYPPASKSGTLEAELYELGGKLLAKVTRRHTGRPLRIDLVAQVNKKDLSDYYLRYRFDSNQDFRQRSLLFVGEILETTVLGQREFVAGTRPVIRVLVRDRASGTAIHGAEVAVSLMHEDNVISKFTAKSDENGEVAAQLQMPDTVLRNARLKITVTSRTATDAVEETVHIRSALRTLLTTDKPLYQPGQTMHLRALTLSQPDMKPLAEAKVTFEVEDAKGNKVFKVRTETDR